MTAVLDEASLDRFSGMPAGPALAAVLELLDPSELDGEDTAAWMRAAFRIRNHADWLLLRSIREACSARAGTTVRVDLDEFAPKIAAASLGWSTSMAATQLDLAVGVLERMPALGEAMRVGRLEQAKASAFVTGLDGLTDAQCAAIAAGLVGEAPELTLSQLRDRILDAAYAVDRVWAANRLAAATARARVSTETAPSGAVNVCGRDLPPDLAQQAKHRLRALALAVRARLRAAGRKIALGFVEARVFVRLMDGTQAGADDAAVIDAVTTELSTSTERTPEDPDDDGGPSDDGPNDDGPNDDGPNDGGPNDGGPGDDDDHDGPEDGPGGGRADDSDPDETGPADPAGSPTRAGTPGRRPGDGSVVFAPETAVRLELSTLLGLDDHPGALPGLGPVPAETARTAAHDHGAATWQLLVHDGDGHLQHLLTLRAPPGAHHDRRHRRQTVQLTAPAALLHVLSPHQDSTDGADDTEAGALAGASCRLLDGATTVWLHDARDALTRSENADPDNHPATTTRERDRRFPSRRLAAWVTARDQTCIALGCTRPAEACDLDHTLDWLHHGTTEAGDLEALCRHDHRAKHEGGWTYEQPSPGFFVITDPTGTRHRTESRVVHPRPAPVTPGRAIAPDPGPPPPPCEDWRPRRTRDGRITREARDTADRLARRERQLRGEPPSRYDDDPDF